MSTCVLSLWPFSALSPPTVLTDSLLFHFPKPAPTLASPAFHPHCSVWTIRSHWSLSALKRCDSMQRRSIQTQLSRVETALLCGLDGPGFESWPHCVLSVSISQDSSGCKGKKIQTILNNKTDHQLMGLSRDRVTFSAYGQMTATKKASGLFRVGRPKMPPRFCC